MPDRIDRLTDKQQARFQEWVDKWIAIGLSTEPADFNKAEFAVLQIYDAIKIKRPRVVLRLGSPLAAHIGGAVAVLLLDGLDAQVWSQVGSQVWSQVGSQVMLGYNNHHRGQFWAGWLAYVSFFRDVCGWTNPLLDVFAIDETLGLNGSWYWWHESVAAISDRPRIILRNKSGALDCESGPALVYPDGWSIWSIGGIRVDEQIVMHPETQTVKQIDGEQNQDVRSIRIDRFGWPRYIKESGAICIEERSNEIEGTLEGLYRTQSGDQRLVVTCPTGRVFSLGIPNDVKSCESAQTWLRGGNRMNVIAAT